MYYALMQARSDLDYLQYIEHRRINLEVDFIVKSINFEMNVISLKANVGCENLILPCKLNTKFKMKKSDIVSAQFGDVFFETGVSYRDADGRTHYIEQWERPTRWFEGRIITSPR